MPDHPLREQIFQIITDNEPITGKEIQEVLAKHHIRATKEAINSILYGELRGSVIRDINERGIPAWRIRRRQFAAAGGLEAKLYKELLKKNIVTPDNSQLGFTVKNPKSGKTYHLDIAVFLKNHKRYNVEIDGFDHIRADALSSIERQITEEGPNVEIEIDWMDNERSYIAFNEIDTKKVYSWLGEHIDWCVRFHEELLWPKDITRNIWLIEKGWKIIRFWNAQVNKDIDKCVKEIHEFIKEN